MALQVELVSPERIAYSGEAKEVIARVVTGDIAFLTGHVPYLGILQSAPVRVLFEDGTELPIAVHQGFVQVADDTVTILSDVCELPDQIDIRRAEAAKAKAEEALRADVGDGEAQDALRRAQTRISVATGVVAGARH
ncbi:MAG TPA: F0F1 ATP synthase subunit epsilon [Microthrixaceae bacterium]|nr:F0F1 ATP synthase subunit epsilon [Microthrixaceae bacterium]HPB46693.1 F0F1 ATP synthase subunit epsilon [Microthrixaceae bacterium]